MMKIDVKEAKGTLFFTNILNEIPAEKLVIMDSNIQDGQGRSVLLVECKETKYILKCIRCSKESKDDIAKSLSEYSNSERLAKNCDFVVRPFKKENIQIPPYHIVEMLFEYFGEDLTKLIGKVTGEETIRLARRTLRPLVYLEKHNTFHSDIKPANFVFIGDMIKLIDFGESHIFAKTGFYTSTIKVDGIDMAYTPAYAPPEIHSFESEIVRNKVDVYCWGMTMYQIIFNKSMSTLVSENERFKKRKESYPEFLRGLGTLKIKNDNAHYDITNFLVPILKQALDFNPRNRPSFSELNSTLKRFDLNEYKLIERKKVTSCSLVFPPSYTGSMKSQEALLQSQIDELRKQVVLKDNKLIGVQHLLDEKEKECLIHKQNYENIFSLYNELLANMESIQNENFSLQMIATDLREGKKIEDYKEPAAVAPEESGSVEEIFNLLELYRDENTDEEYESMQKSVSNIMSEKSARIWMYPNKVYNFGAQIIAKAMTQFPYISALDLGLNSIGNSGIEMLGNSLKYQQNLKFLFLGIEGEYFRKKFNSVDSLVDQLNKMKKSEEPILGLPSKKKRKEILTEDRINNLANQPHFQNLVKKSGITAVGEGLKNNTSLERLDLSFCYLTEDNLMILAKLLHSNLSLKKLTVYCNEKLHYEPQSKFDFPKRLKVIYELQ